MPSESGNNSNTPPRPLWSSSDFSDNSSRLFDSGAAFGDYRAPLGAFNECPAFICPFKCITTDHLSIINPPLVDIISRINPVVVLPPSLEEVHLRRTGIKTIRAKLASSEIFPGYTTVDFSQEAVTVIPKLEDRQALPPTGITLPNPPQQYQNALPQSPLVPVSSISFPHFGKLKLLFNPDQANGLVCSLGYRGILVRKLDPFPPHTPGCHSCVPVLWHIPKTQVVSVFTRIYHSLIILVSLITGGQLFVRLSPVSQTKRPPHQRQLHHFSIASL